MTCECQHQSQNSLYPKIFWVATRFLFFYLAWLNANSIVKFTISMFFLIASIHICFDLPLVLLTWIMILLVFLTCAHKGFLYNIYRLSQTVLSLFMLNQSNFLLLTDAFISYSLFWHARVVYGNIKVQVVWYS